MSLRPAWIHREFEAHIGYMRLSKTGEEEMPCDYRQGSEGCRMTRVLEEHGEMAAEARNVLPLVSGGT